MISVHPLEHPSVLNIFQGDGKARVSCTKMNKVISTPLYNLVFLQVFQYFLKMILIKTGITYIR